MKPLDAPIQIVDSCITCPKCCGQVVAEDAIAIGADPEVRSITPLFRCNDCKVLVGLNLEVCEHGGERHTHMGWVEVPKGAELKPDKSLN